MLIKVVLYGGMQAAAEESHGGAAAGIVAANDVTANGSSGSSGVPLKALGDTQTVVPTNTVYREVGCMIEEATIKFTTGKC
eukprot:958896-Amphidinium_carterae.1